MKKLINENWILAVGVLFLSMHFLTGCGERSNQNSESAIEESNVLNRASEKDAKKESKASTSDSIQESEKAKESKKTEQSLEEQATEEQASITEEAQSALHDLYAVTQDVHPGVAGSMLKAVSAAGNWINTLGSYALSPEQVKRDLTEYLSGCEPVMRAAFIEGWETFRSMGDALAERTPEAVAQLQDAGGELAENAADVEQWQSVRDAILTVLEKWE